MKTRISYFGLLLFVFGSLAPRYTEASSPAIFFGKINTGSKTSGAAAGSYIASLFGNINTTSSFGEIAFVEKKSSLLGTHYSFRQELNGIPIEDAEIVLSVDDSDKSIYRVYNNSVAHAAMLSIDSGTPITEEQAYDIAWTNLAVIGPLMSLPSIKLVYQKQNAKLALVYKVQLSVTEPFGYWEYTIDALSGKIKNKRDIALTRYSKNKTRASVHSKTGPLLDRASEFSRISFRALDEEETPSATAHGSALVFDPDPRTALNDNTLEDDSTVDRFELAYVDRVLKDLAVVGGKYTLQGPFIHIKDFEPPSEAPTTTTDGRWSFKRGNNGFNDAMTYFHIDQNQRYIQSLGFVGAKGIQNGPISVDSNGLSGDDNSHFIPGQNRVAFGHGCVDDNEDTDVILHEYGHAIEDAINRSWHGGDTGAMGEGFGDYWATSYSMTTPNGSTFLPGRVFQWDAGGQTSRCWPGRRVDVENALYNASRSYQAHQEIGEFVSDELWSTPLVQSLREIMALGYPRNEVDQIILEAHFGLGANLTMRDMANAIVQVAQNLYPNKPYVGIFKKHFVLHNIIELPHPTLVLKNYTLQNSGVNNALDPGETVDLFVTLINTGTSDARAVRARITSSNPAVIVNNADVGFLDIAFGAQQASTYPVSISLSRNATCGNAVELMLSLSYENDVGYTGQIPLKIPVGVAKIAGAAVNHQPPLVIPDNDPKGAVSSVWLSDEGKITETTGMTVSIDVGHDYLSDLKIVLIAPSGKSVVLHNKKSVSGNNLVGIYPTTLTPAESLSKFKGELLKGEWKLKAVDSVGSDEGKLNKWGFNVVLGHQCSSPNP